MITYDGTVAPGCTLGPVERVEHGLLESEPHM